MWKIVEPNVAKLYIKDTLYYKTLGSIENVRAIEPNQGPCIIVGQKIKINDTMYIINNIIDITRLRSKTAIEFVFNVTEE